MAIRARPSRRATGSGFRAGFVLIGLSTTLWAGCEMERDPYLPTGPDLGLPRIHQTVVASNKTYTTNADFQHGTLVNVNHDAPGINQLQLNKQSGTFPFIWVALSQRCTIAKINTATGAILGEYRTLADAAGCSESSRTTVAIDGSVWVGHRGRGGVAHIGLMELNQCIDRNGNGAIDTSTGYGDVKAWPGGSVATAQDECILHHVDTDPLGFGDTRHLSIDKNNKLWIGAFSGSRFIRVDGATGAIETAPKLVSCGGYGGLIDGNGVIWSANGGGSGLLRWDPNAPDAAGVNPRCINIPVYGLAIDQAGFVWANQFGSSVRKVSPDGNTILGPFPNGMHLAGAQSQGLAVDANGDVWISSGLFCGGNCPIGHLKNDGTFVGNVPNPTGIGSTGIAVDATGKIWSVNRSSNTATRIDPTGGALGADGVTRVGAVDLTVTFPSGPGGRPAPLPYNYSDMTGAQLLGVTSPQGSWTVTQDGGPGATWSSISWNSEAQGSVPSGSSIVVEARAAAAAAGLGAETFIPISNGGAFNLAGRFLQVRVTLLSAPNGDGPVLSDITIGAQQVDGERIPPFCAISRRGTNAAGAQFIEVTVHDRQSGLGEILVTKGVNSDVVVPPFTRGSVDPLVVIATKINPARKSQVELRVTDVEGNVTYCDPVEVTLTAENRWGGVKIVNNVPDLEGKVTITNGEPGLTGVVVVVNGTRFEAAGLQTGELRTLNVASAMRPGNGNTFVLRAIGSRGATADVLIWDGIGDLLTPEHGGRLSAAP
jgi:streptogramin lyase